MADHVLLVMTEAVAGREAEYNDWYDNVHLAEVLQVPGFVAASRYKAAPTDGEGPPRRFLAIYEINGDLDAAMAGLMAKAPTFVMSEAFDVTKSLLFPFSAINDRMTALV